MFARFSPKPFASIALAIALTAILLWLRWPESSDGSAYLAPYLLPVLIVAVFNRLAIGLVATAIVALLVHAVLLRPHGGTPIDRSGNAVHWALLILSGVVVSVASELGRRWWQRERTYRDRLVQSAHQLRESQTLLQAAFEQAGVGMSMTDLEGRTLRVNRALAEIVGYSEAELVTLGFRSITHPDDLDREDLEVQRLLREDALSVQREKRYRRKDSTVVWVDITSNLVRDAHDRPVYFVAVVKDIGARRAAEAERLLFAEALRQASQPLLITTTDFTITYANVALCTLLGYSLDELKCRSVNDLIPDSAPARQTRAREVAALRETGTYSGETQRKAKDGTAISLHVTIGPVRAPDGVIMSWVVSFLDLRPLHDAQRLTRKLALAVEQSSTQVMITSLNGQIEYANAAVVANSGYTRAELTTMHLRDLHGPAMPPQVLVEVAQALREGASWRGIVHNMSKDGRQYKLQSSLLPLVGDDGRIANLVALGEDITQRLEVEAELRLHRNHLQELIDQRTRELESASVALTEQQQFVRTVTDVLPAMVGYVDRSLRFRFVNAAYANWYAKSATELIGRSVREVVGEDIFAASEPLLLAALRGEHQHFQRTREDRRGTDRHFIVNYIPDEAHGTVRGFITVVTDVTEVKGVELKLATLNEELAHRARQAESATLAKSAFLANMSHEIRTPMNAIIGLTHLMARESRDAQQRHRLGHIDDAAQHLLQIINDVLDLSKIEAGKVELERIEFSLDELIARSVGLIDDQARVKGLELVVEKRGLPQRRIGDPTRLSQAIVNLLSNAVKFTKQGQIRLRAEALRTEGARTEFRFEVQDTGEGIPLASQSQLFKPFEQADSSTTRRFGGTGLGLALTRHLAQMMQGEVGVSSRLGHGSTFWFTVWLEAASDPVRLASVTPFVGLRALLVRAGSQTASALAVQLAALGLTVETACDGIDGARRIESEAAAGRTFDVVVLDGCGSVPPGIDTLRGLRDATQQRVPATPLIAALADPAAREHAQALRCDAVWTPPLTAAVLLEVLAGVLGRAPATASLDAPSIGVAEASLHRGHAGQRVLLVEDNPINQEVAGELLRSAGLVVDTADDGDQAIALACATPYAAILMDMQMPVRDGLSATRAIRARLGNGLPIIAMTANAFGEDRQACLAAGMNDHVAKPVDPEALFQTLLRWLPVAARSE